MLILPAAPAAAVSGKQDDSIVYFLWRGNQAARSYNTPANPQSTNQTAVRNALAQLSQNWATLTDSERAGWTTFAANNPTSDRFGRPVQPTGLNWYIKANSNRLYMGLASVDTAPAFNAPAPLTLATMTASSSGDITIDVPGTPATGYSIKCQIEVPPTAAWTPSIRRSRFVAGVNSGSYQTVAATADQTLAWSAGALIVGSLAACWFTTVRTADGTESTPTLFTDIVSA